MCGINGCVLYQGHFYLDVIITFKIKNVQKGLIKRATCIWVKMKDLLRSIHHFPQQSEYFKGSQNCLNKPGHQK
jgi:hypothetical protein